MDIVAEHSGESFAQLRSFVQEIVRPAKAKPTVSRQASPAFNCARISEPCGAAGH